MTSRKTLAISVAVIVLLAAVAAYEAMQAGHRSRPIGNTSPQAQVALFPVPRGADAINGTATGSTAASGIAIAQPYPGGGPFEPGPAPFGQFGVAGDGLSAWGVAFSGSSDAAAQPDANLIKSAYQNAQKKAETLASATGIKLGKLIAISDYGQNQPYFNGCIQSYQPKGSATGGNTGTGSVPPGIPVPQAGQGRVEILPAPAPDTAVAPCQGKHYVVTWVLLRYQINS